MPSVLLIQIRALRDPMAAHELRCIQSRLHGLEHQLIRRSVLESPACVDWLDNIDGVIIGGSGPFSAHHPESQFFVEALRPVIDRVFKMQLPTFGVCFGHQLIGWHLGAELCTDFERGEKGTVEVAITAAGHEHGFFESGQERIWVHSGHTDHLMERPANSVLLCTNERSEIQMLAYGDAPVVSTQFHPDLLGEEARERYLAFAGESEASRLASERFRLDADQSASMLLDFFGQHFTAKGAMPHSKSETNSP